MKKISRPSSDVSSVKNKQTKKKPLVVAFQLAALTIPRALIALDVSLGTSCQ